MQNNLQNTLAQLGALLERALSVCMYACSPPTTPPPLPRVEEALEPYSGIETDIPDYDEYVATKGDLDDAAPKPSTRQQFDAMLRALPPGTAAELRALRDRAVRGL